MQCLRLEELTIAALAYLERDKYANADEQFAEIVGKLPGAQDF